MLTLTGISKSYREGRDEYLVLHDVSFSLDAGGLAVLGGPSGSGKTTLLNIAGCLTRPTRGSVAILGEEVTRWPEHFLSAVRRERIGFIFQQYHLLPGFTAMENVEIPLLPLGIGERQRRERAGVLLERVGLTAKAATPVQRLSGGEQQRVAVARALINNPSVILADEPTSNVDAETAALILALFAELRRHGRAILVVSHEACWHDAPDAVTYRLNNGRLLAEAQSLKDTKAQRRNFIL